MTGTKINPSASGAQTTETIVERRFPATQKEHGELETIDGVLTVTQEPEKESLRIRYDALKLNYADLMLIVTGSDTRFQPGFLQRLRSSWFQYVDETIRQNARYRPSCCSRAPPGSGIPHRY